MTLRSIRCLVEGPMDEAVVRRILSASSVGTAVFYRRSLPRFTVDLRRFNQAARYSPWFAVCDLDRDDCAPTRLKKYLPCPTPGMCFRIAVRASESWLMADRQAIADFLGVSITLIPRSPEEETQPKQRMVTLARRSRWRAIRAGMVPDEGDSRSVGPEYTFMMAEYARDRWCPRRAAERAPSLGRALERCDSFARTGRWEVRYDRLPPVLTP